MARVEYNGDRRIYSMTIQDMTLKELRNLIDQRIDE